MPNITAKVCQVPSWFCIALDEPMFRTAASISEVNWSNDDCERQHPKSYSCLCSFLHFNARNGQAYPFSIATDLCLWTLCRKFLYLCQTPLAFHFIFPGRRQGKWIAPVSPSSPHTLSRTRSHFTLSFSKIGDDTDLFGAPKFKRLSPCC